MYIFAANIARKECSLRSCTQTLFWKVDKCEEFQILRLRSISNTKSAGVFEVYKTGKWIASEFNYVNMFLVMKNGYFSIILTIVESFVPLGSQSLWLKNSTAIKRSLCYWWNFGESLKQCQTFNRYELEYNILEGR